MRRATVGKLLGLAGLAGVAATGAVLVRDERQRRAYTPDDVRTRLHQRHDLITATATGDPEPPADGSARPVVEPTALGRVTQRVSARARQLVRRIRPQGL